MDYYISTIVNNNIEVTEEQVKEALSQEGFGVLTEVDIQATMKKKLGKELTPYRILGACHPPSAYEALQAEDKIGTMLPCNVILQEKNGTTEVSAVDPVASMQAIENTELGQLAKAIRKKLEAVIDHLK